MTAILTHPELSMKPVPVVAPQSSASGAPTNAAGIDTLGFDGFLLIPQAGALAGNCVVTVTECATLAGTYTPALDDDGNAISITLTDTVDDGLLKIGFFRTDRRLRFIKAIMTNAGTNLVGCVMLLINARDSAHQDVTYSYKL